MDREEFEVDLDVIRDLLRRYGPEVLDHMVHVAKASRESSAPLEMKYPSAANESLLVRNSIISSSGHSLMSTATSASHTTASSHYSDWSQYDPASFGPLPGSGAAWQTAGVQARGTGARPGPPTPAEPFAPDPAALPKPRMSLRPAIESEQDGAVDGSDSPLQCPLCTEFNIDRPIARKPDLKRHFLNTHDTDAQWTCIAGACDLSFDFYAAYRAHVNQVHDKVKDPDAIANLCQQVVFACGYEKCRTFFEAETDADGSATRIEYFDHVLTHVANPTHGKWSYTRRIRNLLHQRLVYPAWKLCEKGDSGSSLSWDPQSSKILRRMLECRHLGDIRILCDYAVLLGSRRDPEDMANLLSTFTFTVPILNTCTMQCHDPRRDGRFQVTRDTPKGHKKTRHRRTEEHAHRGLGQILRPSPSRATLASFQQPSGTICPDMLHTMSASTFTSAPAIEGMPHSGFTMNHDDSVAVSQDEDHPLQLFTASESLGRPPSPDQVITDMDDRAYVSGMADHCKRKWHGVPVPRFLTRRNSGLDSRMGGDSLPPVPAVLPTQQTVTLTRRRSSGSMETFFFNPHMPT